MAAASEAAPPSVLPRRTPNVPPPSTTIAPPAVVPQARIEPSPPVLGATQSRVLWRYPAASADQVGRAMRGCAAVDSQGRVFACVGNRLVMFLASQTTPRWEYQVGGPIPRAPVIGPDGNVRVHSADGLLHIITPSKERVSDPVRVGEPLGWASPLVDSQNNTWISASEGGLLRVQPNGHLDDRPYLRTRKRFDCTGLVHQDVLYIGCEDHYVYAIPLNRERGENAWGASPERGRTGCAINGAIALGPGPTLIIASQDDHLHSFSLDGSVQWKTLMPGQMLGTPVVDTDGSVLVGISRNPRGKPSSGLLVCVDGSTHNIIWQYATGAPIESTPVLGDDGIVYCGDNEGTVHAVDLQGRVQWTEQLDGPIRSAMSIIGEGQLAFGLDNGTIVAIKCSSRALRAGGWPKFLGTQGHCVKASN